LLQKPVSSAPYLEVVETQTDTASRSIDRVGAINFAWYHELLISAAENYDAKNGPMMCLQNRRVNTHIFSDSEYDDTIEPYGYHPD
jgi:hypothetical protein